MVGSYPYGATDPSIYDLDPDYGEYDDGPSEDDCDHDDYEADIVSGDATCWRCGHRWIMTAQQVDAEIDRQRAYYEWMTEQERPWFRFKMWVLAQCPIVPWRLRQFWKPKAQRSLDDEIPF